MTDLEIFGYDPRVFNGKQVLVASAIELNALKLAPGDQVILKDGVWTDQSIQVKFATGTWDHPILFRPESPGGVTLTGTSLAYFDGSHIIVDDLKFIDGHPAPTATSVAVFQMGSSGPPCDNCIANRLTIDNFNTLDQSDVVRSTWVKVFYVSMAGKDSTVANSIFKNKWNCGKMLAAEVLPSTGYQRLHVLNNYFSDRPFVLSENGFEMVQLGWSGTTTDSSYSIFEGNTFERASGEIETIKMAVSDVIVRDNVFRNNKGTLSLRACNRVLVEHNLFDGADGESMGGVRVTSAGHWIVGNRFLNLKKPASPFYWPITLQMGDIEDLDKTKVDYARVKNVVIAKNTFEDNEKGIYVGSVSSEKPKLAPTNVSVIENQFQFNLSRWSASFDPFYFATANGATVSGIINQYNTVAMIDTIHPTVSLAAPIPNVIFLSRQAVQIQATATDDIGVAKVEFFLDGEIVGTDTTAPYSYDWAITPANNGVHRWSATAFDSAGNSSTTVGLPVTVTIDEVPPTVSFLSPTPNNTYRTAQILRVEAAALDDFGVTKVWFARNGITIATVTTAPYATDWPITSTDNGPSIWTATAFDAIGNKTSATLTLQVNVAAPFSDNFENETMGGRPSRWTVVSGINATVAVEEDISHGRVATLSDGSNTEYAQLLHPSAPIEKMYFKGSFRFNSTTQKHFLFLGNGNKNTLYFLMAINGKWFANDENTPLPGPGYGVNQWYAIELNADFIAGIYNVWVDGNQMGFNIPIPAGNTSLSGFRIQPATIGSLGKVWVDDIFFGAAPIISEVSASGITDGGATVSWKTNLPADARVEFGTSNRYGSFTAPDPGMTKDHAIGITGLAPGTIYHYRVISKDESNLIGGSGDMTFSTLADITPPSIVLTAPTASTFISAGNVTFLATASDNVGVTKVWFSRNGVAVATVTASPFSYVWPITDKDNSADTWTATAFDAVDNRSTTAPLLIRVTVPPPFTDNFDGTPLGNPPPSWSVVSGPKATVAVVDGTSVGRSGQCVQLWDPSVTNFCRLGYTSPPMEKVYFRGFYRFGDATQKHFLFLGIGNAGTLYLLTANNKKWLDAKDTPLPGADFVAGQWYKVELLVDFPAQTYAVWVDDRQIGINLPIPINNTLITGFRIQPGTEIGKGTLWVDEIYFATARPSVVTGMPSSSVFKATPPESVDGARAYPVPFRPGHGADGITFDRLPEETAIHIFTIDGRPVKTLTTNTEGKVLWTLDNGEGGAVVSGVYVVLIEKGGTRKKLKVVVQK